MTHPRAPFARPWLGAVLLAAALCACSADAPPDDASAPLDASRDAAVDDATPPDAPPADAAADDAPAEDASRSVGAPAVSGEPRADHRRPSWVWTAPAGATGFRARIDGGAWTELPLGTTALTAPVDLADGVHRFEVAARDGAGAYGPVGAFDTNVRVTARAGDAFWRMDRAMATSPYGHPCAVSAHNAYADREPSAAQNLAGTLARLHAAQAAGADLLELDLTSVADAEVVVSHEDDGLSTHARLADVLDDRVLGEGDQVLFLELKEATPTEAFVRALLDVLAARRDRYARAGRHVVLRAFNDERSRGLELARTLLDTPAYVLLRPYVRLSLLYSQTGASQAAVRAAAARGYAMVEFEYRTPGLMTHVALARSLGLGVNLYTVPVAMGEVFVAVARDSVDVVTVDYPVAQARAVVAAPNGQLLVDVSQARDARDLAYFTTGPAPMPLAVDGPAQPRFGVAAAGEPLVGGRLLFEPAAMRAASFHDADAPAMQGVLLAVVARFSRVALAAGETMSVLAKSDAGAWALEFRRPDAASATVLRCGVHVAGAYHFASVPASRLSTTRAHLVSCAYDGSGSVRLWLDNDATGVATAAVSGGVTNNDVPITLGADPQASGAPRFYFDGEVQVALVQSWGPH